MKRFLLACLAAGAFVLGSEIARADDDGNVQEFLQNTAKDQDVIVYCYHGNSSMGATGYFIENGFTNVASMMGGFEAWRQVYDHEAGG